MDTDPIYLSLGSGNLHNGDPQWLFHDFAKHHEDIRLIGDLEEVDRFSKVLVCDFTKEFEISSGLSGLRQLFFDLVVARDLLEHIAPNQFFNVIQFIWNSLKPLGVLKVQVPQWGSRNAIGDPTHYRGFHLTSFDILDPVTPLGRKNRFYGLGPWKILQRMIVPDSDVNLSFELQKV